MPSAPAGDSNIDEPPADLSDSDKAEDDTMAEPQIILDSAESLDDLVPDEYSRSAYV